MKNNYVLSMAVLCGLLTLEGCQKQKKNPSGVDGTQVEEKAEGHPAQDKNRLLTLENSNIYLAVAQNGGSYVDFHLKEQKLNPFTWTLTREQMPENNRDGAVFQGHFLCLGRWGSPSEAEIAAGVPHNGESSNELWTVVNQDSGVLEMKAGAPMDGLTINRTIKLLEQGTAFKVSEQVKNTFSIGRIYNIVQHGTIGPPFLNKATIINTNANKGFLQSLSYPDPHRFAFSWPEGYADSLKTPLDLRSSASEINYVTTHIFNVGEEYGWITAATPENGLLLGYVWKITDYPWLNVWHHMENGKPVAKGLEFGTTGIGRSYEELLAADTKFHGHNSFEYIDAGEVKTKSFTCFLIPIPKDFNQISGLKVSHDQLVLEEIYKGENRFYRVNL